MGALTNSFSLVLSLFNEAILLSQMASGVGDRISVVGPLEQLGGLQLAELVGLQQK